MINKRISFVFRAPWNRLRITEIWLKKDPNSYTVMIQEMVSWMNWYMYYCLFLIGDTNYKGQSINNKMVSLISQDADQTVRRTVWSVSLAFSVFFKSIHINTNHFDHVDQIDQNGMAPLKSSSVSFDRQICDQYPVLFTLDWNLVNQRTN